MHANPTVKTSLRHTAMLVLLACQMGCGGGTADDDSTELGSEAGGSGTEPEGAGGDAGGSGSEPEGAGNGFQAPEGTDPEDWYEFATDEVTIPSGDEFFMCYVQTIPGAMNIDQFQYEAQPGVHHISLNRLMAPEDRDTFECNVLFRPTWMTIFGTGIGDQNLTLPEGAAQVLPEETQLLVQLHLFNTTPAPITTSTQIHMHRTDIPDPRPVGLYVFGTTEVELPPQTTSTVTNECTVPEDVIIGAMLPHMHYLGQSMKLEVGDANDPTAPMREVYKRDPYTFDNQYVEPFDLTIPAGTPTRVTCSFDNPESDTVIFGESSTNEMCFLVTYKIDFDGQSGCVFADPDKIAALMEE